MLIMQAARAGEAITMKAVVEQEPAVDESCSECQPGPEEVE